MILSPEIAALCLTAASIALLHTLLGPDHYLPFIMMARAGKWSLTKTTIVTFLCGLGHVLGSVALGVLGIVVGVGVSKLVSLENMRGNLAAWLLIGFGLAYCLWGIRRAMKNKKHTHVHFHGDKVHSHEHTHHQDHAHVHRDADGKRVMTPWVLFTIFVLGPCEPLIPILMYPAAKQSISGMALVTTVFSVITITTMLAIVLLSSWGASFARLGKLERYTHGIAGATICLSGLAIQFLGL